MSISLGTIFSIIGWIGAVLYLIGYFLVSRGKLAGDSLRYQAFCLSSGVMLTLACFSTGAWPSMFTNIIFVGIGLYIVMTTKRTYLKEKIHDMVSHKPEAYAPEAYAEENEAALSSANFATVSH